MESLNLPENAAVVVEIVPGQSAALTKAKTWEELRARCGGLQWPEDPLEWQRRIRREESD